MSYATGCRIYFIVWLLISFFSINTYSTPITDLQAWPNLTIIGPVELKPIQSQRFKYWLEAQERIGEDITQHSQSLARTGLGYSLAPDFSFWLGYAFIDTSRPYVANSLAENRIWQQLLWALKRKTFTQLCRTRFEERMFNNNTPAGYRLRQLIKLSIPLNTLSNWSVITSDELFLYTRSINHVTYRGFDQNRFFIGVGYKLTKPTTLELGYLNQYIGRKGLNDFIGNIISLNLLVNF